MNLDKRQILFEKVISAASTNKKKLRFNLNPHLEREVCLYKDVKLLQQQRYSPLQLSESEVRCESFHPDRSVETVILSENEFWDFVYSDKWSEFSSLRITEGSLLDTLVYFLYILKEKGNISCYKVSKYHQISKPQIHTFKKKGNEECKQNRTVHIKIGFVYYKLVTLEDNVNFDIRTCLKLSQSRHTSATDEDSKCSSCTIIQADDGSLPSLTSAITTQSLISEQRDVSVDQDEKGENTTVEYSACSQPNLTKTLSERIYNLASHSNSVKAKKSASFGKASTHSNRSRFCNEKPSSPTPEEIHSVVNFFTDYDCNTVPSISITEPLETVSEASIKGPGISSFNDRGNEEAHGQLDPNELVISEETIASHLLKPVEVQTCLHRLFPAHKKPVLPSIASPKPVDIRGNLELQTPSLYLKVFENKKRMHNKGKLTPLFEDPVEEETCTNDNMSVGGGSFKSLTRYSPLPTKYKKEERFRNLDVTSSISKMNKKQRFNKIARRSPTSQMNRTEISRFLDDFLENKFLPRLKPIGEARCPLQGLRSTIKRIKGNNLAKQSYFQTAPSFSRKEPEDLFKQRIPDDFAHQLLLACDNFLIRKEQVTSADGFKTVTTVTINRIIPCRYGNVN